MITDPYLLLFALIGAHFFFDFAGQGPFMSAAKNPNTAVPGIPWWSVMTAHGVIHGTAVALLTGYWVLGVLEIIFHIWIDIAKCNNRITFLGDQGIHLLAKVAWFMVAIAV